MKYFIPLLALASICTLSGCSRERLTVHTDYISHKNLASFHVDTPDPALANPIVGQRLVISWYLPKSYLCKQNLHLKLTVRFRNLKETVEEIPIHQTSGWYLYKVLNEEYFETEGIQTYLLQLIGDDEVLEEWRHQLWVELIRFEQTDEG